MKRLVVTALAAGVLIALLAAEGASAATGTVVPPGNAAVGEYLEPLPTANGSRPTGTIQPGTARSGVLSPATERAFGEQGPVGRRAAALANATAPASGHRKSRIVGARAGASRPPSIGSGGGGQSPANSLAEAFTGSSIHSGLKALMPVILVVLTIGGGVLALLRRRRRSSAAAPSAPAG